MLRSKLDRDGPSMKINWIGQTCIHVQPFYTYFDACKRLYYTFYFTRPKNSIGITVSKEQFSIFTSISYLTDKRNGNWQQVKFLMCVDWRWWSTVALHHQRFVKFQITNMGSIIKVVLALPTCSSSTANVEWKETVRLSLHCIDLHLKGWPSIAGCLYVILYIRHFISFDLF